MKRSEILKLLDKKLNSKCGYGTVFEDKDTEEVLSFLEELGMQPPAIKEPCETFVLHQGKYVKTEDSFVFTHKWDQE
jgi:hypothetical protein